MSVQCESSVILSLFVCLFALSAKSFPRELLKSFLGLLAWAGLHSRLHFPFMQLGYMASVKNVKRLHKFTVLQLSSAIRFASLPCSFPFFFFLPPGSSLGVYCVFCDAAAEFGKFGIVIFGPDVCISFSLFLPSFCRGKKRQQIAELYSLKAGILKVHSLIPKGVQLALVSDSSSSLFCLSN